MAPSKTQYGPREGLDGWHIHGAAAWWLVALAMCIPAASWLPTEWTFLRAALQILGCFAGGMLFSGKAAIWQRTPSFTEVGLAEDQGIGNRRQAVTGWRYHPAAARGMLLLLILGVCGIAAVPAGWAELRAAMKVLGMFAAGMLAARDAAIWQRTPD